MHIKFGSLLPHVQGELAFVQGELSCCFQCGACALLGMWPFFPFPWFWSWVELLCFSFFLISFSEFHFTLCVVNALIKGEIEDQVRPGGRWMTAPQWLVCRKATLVLSCCMFSYIFLCKLLSSGVTSSDIISKWLISMWCQQGKEDQPPEVCNDQKTTSDIYKW
jgi:hypothetical protein